jgi:hypothetical protein
MAVSHKRQTAVLRLRPATMLLSMVAELVGVLKIGAYIEELDIFDLKKLMKKTDNEDILRVYSRLLWGSENHFRAFTRNLSNRGVEYEPEFLTKEEMETMLNKYNQRNRNWNRE